MEESQDNKKGKIGPVKTFLTLIKGFLGTAVLFLPKAYYTGGWGFMSIMLTASCALTCFTSLKLIQIRLKHELSYPEIGFKAYGVVGKALVDVFLLLTHFLFVCAYITFIANSVNNVLYAHFDYSLNKWIYGAILFVMFSLM